jgi:hypothetical protein
MNGLSGSILQCRDTERWSTGFSLLRNGLKAELQRKTAAMLGRTAAVV